MSEAEEQAWQKHKSEWPLEVDVLPLNHEFAFRMGYRSAPAVSLPDRETLAKMLEESLYERGNRVAEWPEDEAEAYREFRWAEGIEAARKIMFTKAADAVLAALSLQSSAQSTEGIPEADATPDEAFDLGRVPGYNEALREAPQLDPEGMAIAALRIFDRAYDENATNALNEISRVRRAVSEVGRSLAALSTQPEIMNEGLWDFADELLDAWNIEDTNPPSLSEQFRDLFIARFGSAPTIQPAAGEVEWGIDYGDDDDEPRRCSEEMARKRASKEFGDKIVHRTVIPPAVGPWIEDAS